MIQTEIPGVEPVAVFSPCRQWRYELWRRWAPGPFVQFIGLNPSTADEVQDDPTVRRCIAYSKRWGFSALCMTNLFAWRSTDPRGMKAAVDPVGPANDETLTRIAGLAGLVIAAWGVHGTFAGRADHVLKILPVRPLCLAKTKDGHPGHPLYLRADAKPIQL